MSQRRRLLAISAGLPPADKLIDALLLAFLRLLADRDARDLGRRADLTGRREAELDDERDDGAGRDHLLTDNCEAVKKGQQRPSERRRTPTHP